MPSLLDPSITNPGYTRIIADGVKDTFLVGYEYPDRDKINDGEVSPFITVRVNGSDVTYTVKAEGALVVLDAVPASTDEVEIFRDSDFEAFLVLWSNRTPVNQDNLFRMGSQMIWLAQENLNRLRFLRDQFSVFIDASNLVQEAADDFNNFETQIAQLESDLAALELLFGITNPVDGEMLVYDTGNFKNKVISGDFLISTSGVVTIQPGVVTAAELGANAVITDKIQDLSVLFSKLAPDAVDFIENGGIAAAELSDLSDVTLSGQLNGDLLVYDTTGATWRNQAISGDLTVDETGAATISANAVSSGKLAPLSVSASNIQTNAVGSNQLADGAVILGKLASNSITSIHIQNDAITGDKIANFTIATIQLQASSVTSAKLGPMSVTSDKITNQAVGTSHIANNAVELVNLAAEVAEAIGTSNTLYNIVSPVSDDILIYDGSVFNNVPMSGDLVLDFNGVAQIVAGAITPSQLSFIPVETTVDGQTTVGGQPDTNYLFDGEVIVARSLSSGGGQAGMHNSRWVSTIRTTDATPTDMLPTLIIPDGDSWLVHIQIIGRDDAGGNFWSSTWHGHISRNGTSTTGSIIEDTDAPTSKPAGWNATVSIDDGTEEMVIEVTGASAVNINWAASVEITRTLQ